MPFLVWNSLVLWNWLAGLNLIQVLFIWWGLWIFLFITIRPEWSAVLRTLPMACEQQDLLLFFYMNWLPRPPGVRSHLLRSSSAEWLRVRWWSGDTSLCLGSATCQLWILRKDNNEDDNHNHNHNIRTYLIGLLWRLNELIFAWKLE